jgi:Zn-dependent protease with chaperone function
MSSEVVRPRTRIHGSANASEWTTCRDSQASDRLFLQTTGGTAEILLSFVAAFLPFIIFPAVLLGIVFIRRIQLTQTSLSSSSLNSNENEDGVYYVAISSTTLVLMASFSSSMPSIVVGFVMNLLSYPISRSIVTQSQEGRKHQLPTPYQLGLLITLRNGGWSGLWCWIKYITASARQNKTVGTLRVFAWGLVTSNVIMYLLKYTSTDSLGC